jgi:hypothetical protein
VTASPAAAGAEPVRSSRDERLADAVARLRTRVDMATVDRWLMTAGPVLVVFGLLLICLGWYGASNTTRVFLQIPYMISGGLLGVGFMFTGGFLYFSRWLNDLVNENQRQAEAAERQAEVLDRIEALLAGGAVAVDGAALAPASVVTGTDSWVATPRGKLYHRPDCSMVSGREVRSVNGDVDDLEPCQICEPA